MSDQPPGPPVPSQPSPPFPQTSSAYSPPPPPYPSTAPGQVPPPVLPTAIPGRATGLVYQFSGSAGWACLLGLIGIIVPFAFNRIFFFLPLIGLLAGVQAIRRGRMIGGIVGIMLNAIAGVITIIGLTAG